MPENQTDPQPPLSARWALPAIVAGVVCLLYVGTLMFGFVYDDNFQIVENTWLTSARYIPRYFTSHVWAFAGVSGVYWRPLFLLWLFLLRSIFGLAPVAWHAATVLMHGCATLMVFALARRLTGDRTTAAVTAVIFGVHPALIESVAWVSGVPDPLLVVVLVPAFLFYLDWRETGSRRALWLSFVFFVLALMSKEPAIMLLPIIAAHAWIYGGNIGVPPVTRNIGDRVRQVFSVLLPYIAIAVLYLIFHAALNANVVFKTSPATPATTLLTIPSLLLFYVRLLVWPAPISPEYGLRMVEAFSLAQFLVPALILAALVALLWMWARYLDGRNRELARLIPFATIWLFLFLAPVLNIKPLDAFDFAHVRYLYIPCIGFAMLVATAVRMIPADDRVVAGMPARQFAAALIVVLALAATNLVQQVYWASNIVLFTRGVNIAPRNPTALTGLGMEFGKRGKYDDAMALMQRALKENPNDWHANFGIGYTYLQIGKPAEAEVLIEKAIRLWAGSEDPDQWAYLGMAALRIGDVQKAEWAVRNAIRRRPDVARYHHALGLILEQQHRPADAATEFRETLKYDPNNADARDRLQKLSGGT